MEYITILDHFKIPTDFTNIFCSLVEILNGIIIIFLGSFVFLHNPRDTVKRLFLILSISIAYISLTGPVVYALAYNGVINYGISGASIVAQIMVPPLLLNLYLHFPRSARKKHLVPLVYFPALIPLISFFCLDPAGNLRIVDGALHYKSSSILLFILYMGLYYSVITILLAYRLKKERNGLYRSQLFYTLLGLSAGCFINFSFALLRSIFQLTVFRSGTELGSLFIIGFLFYAIVKYQAYDIKTAIHYSVYRFASYVLFFCPLVILPFLVFDETGIEHAALYFSTWGSGSVLYFVLVTKLVMPFINRITMRRKTELTGALDTLFEKLDVSLTLENAEQRIFESIRDNIYSSDAALLTRGRSDNELTGTFVCSGSTISLEKEFSNVLREYDSIITKKLMMSAGGQFAPLVARGVELVVQVVTKDRTAGLLCVSGKRNLEPYRYEELEFVRKIAQRLALIMEKDRAVELGRLKTEYFVTIAHELKSPLTIVCNYIGEEIAKRGRAGGLGIIEKNVDKMKNDILNLLDLEKLESGEQFYDHNLVVDLSQFLEVKTGLYREIASVKKLALSSHIEKGVYLKIDPYAIDRVVTNLVENAIKYNNANGKISVRMRTAADGIRLVISDTGIGIPDESKGTIFNPYYQVPHANRTVQGIGIGLSIVKKIVDQVRGSIIVKDNPGGGTAFEVVFERHTPSVDDRINPVVEFSKPVPEVEIEIPVQVYSKDKETIFIVEDNQDMLNYLHSSLASDFNIFYACDGRSALLAFESIPLPHLVISDIMMSGMDGFEMLDAIQRDRRFAKIPIIFLTAKTDQSDRCRAIAGGAIDFISKPFSIDELILKAKSIIKHEHAREVSCLEEFEDRIHSVLMENMDERKKNEILFTRLIQFYITRKEFIIIQDMMKGLNNRAIADSNSQYGKLFIC